MGQGLGQSAKFTAVKVIAYLIEKALMDETQLFYDDLARDYHLIHPDWEAEVRQQAGLLDRLLRDRLRAGPLRVLDCTCGIGTQALGLAQLGHDVVGTDLSPVAIKRAHEVASSKGTAAWFKVCDVRQVHSEVFGDFDVVLSCHNSLPHLLSALDLSDAIASMAAKVRPGGLLLLGVRDYDEIVSSHPPATLPKIRGEADRRRLVFQTWTWHPDGLTYDLEHFLGIERDGAWTFQTRRVRCRAIVRTELLDLVTATGLVRGQCLEPQETGFFELLYVAAKP
jgi:SAM-dependent methyltransferase